MPRTVPALRSFALACALLAVDLPAQSADQAAVQVTAVGSSSPPSITFSWPVDATATGYTVSRRPQGTTLWGPEVAIPGGAAATSWTDTAVQAGTLYEYWFGKLGTPPGRGFVSTGIEVAAVHERGTIVLLVDATKVAALGSRFDRLKQDLVGDGWTVHAHEVFPTQSPPSVRSLVIAEAIAAPGTVKSVFLLGDLPVPYSGDFAPDTHSPDHRGAWPADLYYGERHGPWTDSVVNFSEAVRVQNHNVPGDGKFDQSTIPSDVDIAVGRVDLSDMPMFAASETQLLQAYLDKDHAYRHKEFDVEHRAVIDDNFGLFAGDWPAASAWRSFSTLVGPANVSAGDYFSTLNTQSGGGYVFACGCGAGSYISSAGVGTTADFATSTNRNVFTMLFGSYFGDWDSTNNFLRAPLCSGWTLASVWTGRPHWSLHQMGMGETLGYCARASQNDIVTAGLGLGRATHVALMGDPTLRLHIVAPPSAVTVADAWPQAVVSWSDSADPVDGYHVYRALAADGPFVRLTTSPVAGLAWVDTDPLVGTSTYMVRATRLETTPSGSYWNLSQGAFVSTLLPQEPASHTSYGAGCYTISDSFYQYLPTAAGAAAACAGRSITLSPAGGSYSVSLGSGGYMAPTASATALAFGDDDQVGILLAAPFVFPGGSTTTLHVHENGIVSAAPLSMTAVESAEPMVATLLGEASAAWYSWHDFDPSEPGSGNIVAEEVAGVLCVTWNGVESGPDTLSNPSTLQFQFELATGVVRFVWDALAQEGVGASQPGEQHLVGWSPGGPSVDAGPIDFVVDLPRTIPAGNMRPPHLQASPPPVSTQTAGTMIHYTIDDVPEAGPGIGIHLGLVILGWSQFPTGLPLSFVDMPGCSLFVDQNLLTLLFLGNGPSLTTSVWLPEGMAPGSTFYAQAAALVMPYSLPNGLNGFGAVVSNGITSLVNGL